jgi:hypothetical protein
MLFSKPGISPAKILVCLSVSLASTPAMANPACALSLQGCVLPVQDVVVQQPVTVAPAPVMIAEEPKSFGLLPILAGLAALGVLAYLLLDDDEENLSP